MKEIIYKNYPMLTVFTPAYNRAYTIHRTYESLCRQHNKGFIWLIIDDGSTDDTAALVKKWQQENDDFEIRYIYKENGGMHTAHNVAYENIDTELNVCIDSDDMLGDNAVEIIYSTWKTIRNKRYAGIIGLDADFSGVILGTKFDRQETTLYGFYGRRGTGDKKIVYRTDVMRQYPEYPVFGEEKLVPLSYKYLLCDQEYTLFAINEVLCNVEYQTDGSTNNMWKQRVRNAKGFAFHKSVCMQYPLRFTTLIRDTIIYIACSKLAGNKKYVQKSPRKVLTCFLLPAGQLFYIITKKKSGLF